MWVLILTITATTSNGSNAIASIPGFKTIEACHAAQEEWLRHQKNASMSPSAICAKQD